MALKLFEFHFKKMVDTVLIKLTKFVIPLEILKLNHFVALSAFCITFSKWTWIELNTIN